MFKRDDDSLGCALFHEIEPQISNSSLYVEYTGDMLLSRDSSLELRQKSKSEIASQMLFDEKSAENEFK